MEKWEYIEGFKVQYAIRLDKAMKDYGVTVEKLGDMATLDESTVRAILRGDHDRIDIEYMGYLLWLCEHGGE